MLRTSRPVTRSIANRSSTLLKFRNASVNPTVTIPTRINNIQRIQKNGISSTRVTSQKAPKVTENIDPQQMASEFVQFSAARKQGTESVQELTQTQMLQNYALATSLIGFVVWVWYYSMTSVGRPDGGMEQLLIEAEGARGAKEKLSVAEQEVDELLKKEMSLGSMDSADEAMGGKGMVVAVAAPDEIARQEEERNLGAAAGTQNGISKGKPLWKKVVFFWRNE